MERTVSFPISVEQQQERATVPHAFLPAWGPKATNLLLLFGRSTVGLFESSSTSDLSASRGVDQDCDRDRMSSNGENGARTTLDKTRPQERLSTSRGNTGDLCAVRSVVDQQSYDDRAEVGRTERLFRWPSWFSFVHQPPVEGIDHLP